MLEKIKSLYGHALVVDPQEMDSPEEYFWFKTEAGIPFGLKKVAVTEKEYQLLSLSYQPEHLSPSLLTAEERAWSECLYSGKKPPEILTTDAPRYFLHFYFKTPLYEAESFKEAVNALFDESPIVLWKDDHHAVVILKKRPDKTKSEDISQILAADFYSDISLFVGTAQNSGDGVHSVFQAEEKAFVIARKSLPQKRTYFYEYVLPLLLLSELPKGLRQTVFSPLLEAVKDEDPDWMHSIDVFFEHGMNMTSASKSLFIHRNSLQYRLDKFSEKTGLDPKRFEDGFFIYLALLSEKLQ
ncbi:MAG: PucR family transcriptional regulator [Tuberibacillus sp.]